jgi:class 3 adenylate cyclase
MVPAAEPSATLAVLFADVVGSTKLYELLGDVKARETVGRCIEVMTKATDLHGGRVVKTMGDEVMATFTSADDAVEAACKMQRMIKERLSDLSVPVAIRVGLHYGPVVLEQGDVFGGTVHLANRMTSQAKASQIMTTATTVDELSPNLQAMTRQIDLTSVTGRREEVVLCEVLWLREDSTTMLPTINLGAAAKMQPRRLTLRYRNTEVIVSEEQPNVNIGRSEDSDLVVKDSLISRLHARVEYRRGKFMLVDLSTNGTCLVNSAGEELYVRRDSVQIKGRGMIGLGRLAEANASHTIEYACEE